MEREVDVRLGRATRKQIWIATTGLFFIYFCIGLAIRYPALDAKVPVRGDEQHYITQALSLLKDGDLVVVNNYDRGDYLQFYEVFSIRHCGISQAQMATRVTRRAPAS